MGQFSWLDCRSNEQIVDDKRRDVFVLVPYEFGGGHIAEKRYDGYGNFGGHDIYELVLDWNKDYIKTVLSHKDDWKCPYSERDAENLERFSKGEPIDCEKRWLGIILACYDEDNVRLRYPIKITHDRYAKYEWCAPSLTDPNQGWPDYEYYDEDDVEDE